MIPITYNHLQLEIFTPKIDKSVYAAFDSLAAFCVLLELLRFSTAVSTRLLKLV
jgi:hypothetical protein